LVEIIDRGTPPQPVFDFLASDNFSPTLHQHPQNLKYLLSEQNLIIRARIIRIGPLKGSYFASAEIELEGSESNAF
jgi:hypothetical protein